MAIDTDRARRRLMDAGLEEGPATGVADLVDESTDGLATETGLAAIRTELAKLETKMAERDTRMTRNIIVVVVACTGVILAAMRLGV